MLMTIPLSHQEDSVRSM